MGRLYRHRRLVQVFSAVIFNANLGGFFTGTIYKGPIKGVCAPGLNCYSCPGALTACPIGSLQAAFTSIKYKVPLYLLGTLLLFGTLFGRAICSFLCPFGLIQEWLYKIPTPKIKKGRWSRGLSHLKYVILAVFVLGIPLFTAFYNGVAVPAFCKYICPAGTLTGGIPLVAMNPQLQALAGALFNWKLALLGVFILSSIFIYRPFCRFICPLGAFYSFFNRVAPLGIQFNKSVCNHCGACAQACKMDVKHVNDRECIRCGDCKDTCRQGAIQYGPSGIKLKENQTIEKKNQPI